MMLDPIVDLTNLMNFKRLGPVVQLPKLSKRTGNEIYALLGSHLPTGSLKFISVLGMMSYMMEKGLLRNCTDIFSSSSGNTALATAAICKRLGLRFHAVIDERIAPGKETQLIAEEVDLIKATIPDPHNGFVGARIKLAQQLVGENKGAVDLDQYTNPGAILGHYYLTGPWIWQEMNRKIDAVVAPLGTGGTFGGTAFFLSKVNSRIITLAVDCRGSALIYGHPEPHFLTGLGAAFIPQNVIRAYSAIQGAPPKIVDDKDAFLGARWVLKNEGIGIGGSSGAAIVAAIGLSKRMRNKRIVVLFPDDDTSYRGTIFNDSWMKEKGFLG